MKKIMMLTLVLSVMAMGSAMANGNCADRKPKRGNGVYVSLMVPPSPHAHHCCDCDKLPHHKCDKRVSHGPKSAHYKCGHGAPNKHSKCGKPRDNRPSFNKNNRPANNYNGRNPGRR